MVSRRYAILAACFINFMGHTGPRKRKKKFTDEIEMERRGLALAQSIHGVQRKRVKKKRNPQQLLGKARILEKYMKRKSTLPRRRDQNLWLQRSMDINGVGNLFIEFS
jgi:hypothetical protein